MSTIEDDNALLAAAKPKARRGVRAILLALLAQYVIVAGLVGATVAATLHYLVTPQIVATFETLEAAFKRLPPR